MNGRNRGGDGSADALDAVTVKRLLAEVGHRLHRRGLHVDIYLVGGAAIALTFDYQRITADVDAIFADSDLVRQEAAAVAREHNLPDHWLNDRAAMFLPGAADPGAVRLEVDGLTVSVASPAHVLAMKMASFRPGKDQDDLVLLFSELGIETPEQAADLVLAVSGHDTVVLPRRAELILSARAVLERMSGRPARQQHRAPHTPASSRGDSAQLVHPAGGPPGGVGGPHVGVEPLPEGQAESVGEG